MRKPRGGQIRANRLIGPRKVLGEGDRRVPAKGRGRTAPYRGRSAASWIWSTPLDASASEGELRSGYALTPSPSHSRNNLSFLQKGGPRKGPSQRTATALFFLILVWGFPIVAAGILFDVDQRCQLPPHLLSITVGLRGDDREQTLVIYSVDSFDQRAGHQKGLETQGIRGTRDNQ